MILFKEYKMFTIEKYKKAIVGSNFIKPFMTSQGECTLDKGEHVTLVEAKTISGDTLFGIRKQSQRIIWLPATLFKSFKDLERGVSYACCN